MYLADLIPSDFAQTGITALPATGQHITQFQVLGERSSGTNFVKRLIGRNSSITPTEALGWKHGFHQSMAIPPDLGLILMVRRADVWALSMHAKPWHTRPAVQKLEFSDFLHAPWDTIIDRKRYFGGPDAAGIVGQILQQDRDPLTGAMFDNLFALRRAKLINLLSYLNRHRPVVLLRMERAQAAPEETVDIIIRAFGQPPRNKPFAPVRKRLGSRFVAAVKDRPPTPDRFLKSDIHFLRKEIDVKLEGALGYNYGDPIT